MNSLSEILQEVISAAAARDWEKVESAAENLKVWARAAGRKSTPAPINTQEMETEDDAGDIRTRE